jgi:hypothetical protein
LSVANHRSIRDSPALIVRQPEGLVAAVVELRYVDWPARNITELILPERWDSGLEGSPGVVGIIPVEFKQGAVNAIRAALTYDVDLVRAEAIFRRVVAFGP